MVNQTIFPNFLSQQYYDQFKEPFLLYRKICLTQDHIFNQPIKLKLSFHLTVHMSFSSIA